jgi:hypothetical protein
MAILKQGKLAMRRLQRYFRLRDFATKIKGSISRTSTVTALVPGHTQSRLFPSPSHSNKRVVKYPDMHLSAV